MSVKKSTALLSAAAVLLMSSCTPDNSDDARMYYSEESFTTAARIDFKCGRYYPEEEGLNADVYLDITESTIELVGSDKEVELLWRHLWEKSGEEVDKQRLAELTEYWSGPRDYIVSGLTQTYLAWEWGPHGMVSGGHFEDETHFEFYSVNFEYGEE